MIEPQVGWPSVNYRELYQFRELLYIMIWRDVKARYKQTAFGAAWAVVPPFVQMIIFTIIFGRLAQIDSEGIPYAAFVYTGLLPWTLFAHIVQGASQSVVSQTYLMSKVYFPRLLIPAATAGLPVIDFLVGFCFYGIVLAYHGIVPGAAIVFLPLLWAVTIGAALGLGSILASLTVFIRDLTHGFPMVIRTMMWATPVVYPLSTIPSEYHWLVALNPMTGIIEAHRAIIFGKPLDFALLATSCMVTMALLLFGLRYFRKCEQRYVDII